MPQEDKVCTRCVMDSTDPAITFDESGVCSFCKRYEEVRAHSGYRPGESERELERTVRVMKERGRDREYDCILGLSGGVDSAYMLYLANKLGLRVLAVHVDSGWNSEMAVSNIEKMCQKLDVRLHTYVMDWPTMKELQRAYLLSGVANLDVPQDHLFCAAIYQMARKYRVKYILNGSNIATEGADAPFSLQHTYRDAWHLKSIYRKHGRGKSLKNILPCRCGKRGWACRASRKSTCLTMCHTARRKPSKPCRASLIGSITAASTLKAGLPSTFKAYICPASLATTSAARI